MMEPVRTEDCNILYKGHNEQTGDLWVHRVRPGVVRATYELSEEELNVLKAGGRVQLYMLREPISAVKLVVISKEESEPTAPHGFKVDKMPGDKLDDWEKANGNETQEEEQFSHNQSSTTQSGEAAETVSSRA